MYLFKEAYENIDYLKSEQSENFLAWICPLLTQTFFPMDQYVYYETDIITEIYFVQSGFAGFVLPFKYNIVYIEVLKGDFFGEIDFVVAARENDISVE